MRSFYGGLGSVSCAFCLVFAVVCFVKGYVGMSLVLVAVPVVFLVVWIVSGRMIEKRGNEPRDLGPTNFFSQ